MKIIGEIIGRLIYVLYHKGLLTDIEYTYIISPLSKMPAPFFEELRKV